MINHLFIFMILLNQMFQIGSADLNEDKIKNNIVMINEKVILLKEMANNLMFQLTFNEGTESGQFTPSNSKNLDKLNVLMNRIKNIENKIKALSGKGGDSENIKVRVNELETELEDLRKSLDKILKENIHHQDKLEKSLANVTDAYNDLAKRVAIIEEKRSLNELPAQLTKGNYRDAKLNVDVIVHDDKLIDVMKKVYEEQKDIDGYLYLAGIVDKLSRRLVIYQYIYNDIIMKGDYKHAKENVRFNEYRNNYLSSCYCLKLIYMLEISVFRETSGSDDIYNSANSLTAKCKKFIIDKSKPDSDELQDIYKLIGIDSIISNTSITDTAAAFSSYNKSTIAHNKIFQIGFYLDDLNSEMIECLYKTTFLIVNRNMLLGLVYFKGDFGLKTQLGYDNVGNLKLSNYGITFIISLKKQNYKFAADIFKDLKSNNEIEIVIKQYCKEFDDVDSILLTAELLTENDKAIIYRTLYDAIDKTSAANICDMLKLLDIFVNLSNYNSFSTIINNLKSAITSAIKNDLSYFIKNPVQGVVNNYWNLKEADFNEINIYSKDFTKIIIKHKYYLVKENGKNNCYFDGTFSLNNYDDWFSENRVYKVFDWVSFLGLFSKLFNVDNNII